MNAENAVAMIDVIIAYSGADAALVAPIAERAAALGVEVRLAPQPEQQDDASAQDVATQIDEAGALLVCWSERAVASSAVRNVAATASARGKLAACRLAPCVIPFPFDAVATADLQNWAGRVDSPEWARLVGVIGETLRRPGLSQLLAARVAGDEDALDAFAKRFPQEPESRRIWSEREAKYRVECASVLRDARHHLEQRVASEQSKIENALATFARDFDAWLERERRGEATPKPNLNTLFGIWLERGGRRSDAKSANGASPSTDDSLRRGAEAAEAKAHALQERLDAETGKVEELERRLRAAELQRSRQPQSEEPFPIAVPPPASTTLIAAAKPKRRRRMLPSVAALLLLVVGAGAAAEWIKSFGREPPQMREAREWFDSALTTIETQSRDAIAVAVETARENVLNDLLEADKDRTIARAVAFDPSSARARLREIAPEPSAPAVRPAPDAFLSSADARERKEIVAAVVKAAPVEVVAQLLAVRKDETIDELLRSERASVQARLREREPQDAVPAPAAAASVPAADASPPLARPTQSPPREIVKTLEANVSAQNQAEPGKSLPAAAPQKLTSYRVYDNRDIVSDKVAKLRDYDQQACIAACRKKESCKAYTYDKWNRVCYLKSAIGDFKLNPRSSSGVREDMRMPKAPAGEITMERYPSKAFPGAGYKSVRSDGPDVCEDNCRADDACVAFTFRLDEGACHLFKTTGEYFSNQLADSGGKRQE